MALPTSRNTTYIATTSEVKAADLNDIQDKIVDLRNVQLRTFVVSPAAGFTDAADTPPDRDDWGRVASLSSGASGISCPLHLNEGEILSSVSVYTDEPNLAGEEIVLDLASVVAGVATFIGDTITSGVTGASVTHVWDDTTNDTPGEIPFTVPTGSIMHVRIAMPQTSVALESKVFSIKVVTE